MFSLQYLKEPGLSRERRLMTRDIIIVLSLGLFVVIGSILCVYFSKRLQDTDRDVGASLLIVFPTAGVILYMGFLMVSTDCHKDRKKWLT